MEPRRSSCGDKDLAAVPGSHHPRGPVQRRPEIIRTAQIRFTRPYTHPHGQQQGALRVDRGIYRGPR
jgi:hypothetical protein